MTSLVLRRAAFVILAIASVMTITHLLSTRAGDDYSTASSLTTTESPDLCHETYERTTTYERQRSVSNIGASRYPKRAAAPTCQQPANLSSNPNTALPSLLHTSSLWAIGADARYHLPRRTWQQVQTRQRCTRVTWFRPWQWGITSQIRDYSDLAIISVFTFNRTLLPDGSRKYPTWCQNGNWLECFFEPLTGSQCKNTKPHGRVIRESNIGELGSNEDGLVYRSRASSILHNASLFPHELWDRLVAANHVRYKNTVGGIMDAQRMRRLHPRLYHHLSLSALRCIISNIIFVPQRRTVHKANSLVSNISSGVPVAAIHLRWTDKKADGGVASGLKFNADHVLASLDYIEKRTSRSYQSLLVLSDDPSAVNSVRNILGDTYDVFALSSIKTLFRNKADYEKYIEQGHTFTKKLFKIDPQATWEFSESVIVDMIAAANTADYLVGVGSSGVSQLIAQWMGANRRIDGNSFAVWQEDITKSGN